MLYLTICEECFIVEEAADGFVWVGRFGLLNGWRIIRMDGFMDVPGEAKQTYHNCCNSPQHWYSHRYMMYIAMYMDETSKVCHE